MDTGTIEMAAKIRYDAMVAEGQREQFVALDCVAPVGVWDSLTAARQWVGSIPMHVGRFRVNASSSSPSLPRPALTPGPCARERGA